MSSKRVLIVGGVAGGASAAARLRRLDEKAEIIMFERGEFASFANCGLPYYVGDVIKDEDKLLVAKPALFKNRFNIGIRLFHEVVGINRQAQTISVRNVQSGATSEEKYTHLVIATGADAVKPPFPGINEDCVFCVRNIPDTRKIRGWIEKHNAKKAVVIGASFIGLEMAENLKERGLDVSIVELCPQIMPTMEPELTFFVEEKIRAAGVELILGDGVKSFDKMKGKAGVEVGLCSGKSVAADLVILAIGVRPCSKLAVEAGLEVHPRTKGIKVTSEMLTSDPHIYAVGDATMQKDFVTGEDTYVPLAGPANLCGRIAANNISGRKTSYRGVQGTGVCGAFGGVMAMTGASQRTLKMAKIPYLTVTAHPSNHAGYYPGAQMMHVMVYYHAETRVVLGGQASGGAGVEKVIDALAVAVQMRAKVDQLEELELCYAPPFGSAKSPLNILGMIAHNAAMDVAPFISWEEYYALEKEAQDKKQPKPYLLDVRGPNELKKQGAVPGAVNIKLETIRGRLNEIPKDKPVYVFCRVGKRGHYGTALLRQHGFNAINVLGGLFTLKYSGKLI